ncbi:hypothetical protein Syun_029523 [Stephania yunnanensis]|uniref:Uncharacterized protein n=1 Tax=Stephania yunnanensis TaxID=152371 RepID=A0AAP0EDY6_9MAGN
MNVATQANLYLIVTIEGNGKSKSTTNFKDQLWTLGHLKKNGQPANEAIREILANAYTNGRVKELEDIVQSKTKEVKILREEMEVLKSLLLQKTNQIIYA